MRTSCALVFGDPCSAPLLLFSTANSCNKDVADIAAELGFYEKAVQKFEEVRQASVSLPFSAADTWMSRSQKPV